MPTQSQPLVAEAGPALAPRSVRALAVLVDSLIAVPLLLIAWTATFGGLAGILGSLAMHPHGAGGWAKVWGARLVGAGSTVVALVAWAAVCALSLYQLYMLGMRGQTIGKRLFGIRIVDMAGRPAGFVRALFLRTCLFPSVMAFVAGLLSGFVPIASILLCLADLGFGLRADRRCLHDHFAGTQVRWVRITAIHTRRVAAAFALVAVTGATVYGLLYRATLLALLHGTAAVASAQGPATPTSAVAAQPAVPPLAAPPAPTVGAAPAEEAEATAPLAPAATRPVAAAPTPPPADSTDMALYRYEDAQGVIHFVKSLDEVPEALKASARPVE